MQAVPNRTFICSVVFLDIVEYSKKPVAEQIVLKERLNRLLTDALADVPLNDRIILDTGDGAALSFLGDPEDALLVSLSLRDSLAVVAPLGPQMKMRIGINLGPVKLVKDINGQPNIIGDGINVAQRVMSFASPGSILASRSFYEIVSRMSDEYAPLFHYEGSRTDKHVREHEVYELQPTPAGFGRAAGKRARSASDSQSRPVMDQLAHSASFVGGGLRHRPRLSTALAVIAILVVAVGIRSQRPIATVAAPEAAAPKAAVAVAPTPTPAPPPTLAPAPVPAQAAAETPANQPDRKAEKKPAPAPAARAETARQEPPAPAAGGAGTLSFTITPWGEVYVDGAHVGTTPPLDEIPVGAGRHRIEVRHPDFPAYARTVEVRPGGRVIIKHWFQPREQPNPLDRLKRLWK